MTRRAGIAIGVIALWLGGLGVLLHRELFRPQQDRFTEASLRVNPGAMYYAVMQEGSHVGYSSTTVDTMPDTVRVTEYLVADVERGRRTHRTEARTEVLLTRTMRLRSFSLAVNALSVQMNAQGVMEGDSVLRVISRRTAAAAPDTQRIVVDSTVVLPSVVPLLAVLMEPPATGRSVEMDVFDPISLSQQHVVVRLAAETTFVIPDSAVMSPSGQWVGALPIQTRAWRMETDIPSQLTGWVDPQGRMVRASYFDALTLERMPHEMAFENWRSNARRRATPLPPPVVPAPASSPVPSPSPAAPR